MTPSAAATDCIKLWETCQLTAFIDDKYGKQPTIGWGRTKGVKLGDTCTQAQADQWLVEDVQGAVRDVNDLVKQTLKQCEFDALVSFVYNIGGSAFENSTMLKYINQHKPTAMVAGEFLRWNKDNGAVLAGLVKRRRFERQLYLGTVSV